MGITSNCTRFLAYATTQGVRYHKTIMLGRQMLFASNDEIKNHLNQFKIPFPSKEFDQLQERYAEPLFKSLGAEIVDSLDYSSFEKATVIADMNQPIPDELKNKYTTVFDGGTLEHVFNFPQAIKNCMDMIRIGGHFLSITPTNNQSGHGFYQFSPELFFSIFILEHGFKLHLVALGVEMKDRGIVDWYAIEDPMKVKKRVTLINSLPTYLMVIAEKIKETDSIVLRPMQSDYQFVWEVFDSMSNDIPIEKESRVMYYYRKYLPEPVKKVVRYLAGRSTEKMETIDGLGKVNPHFFKKMKF